MKKIVDRMLYSKRSEWKDIFVNEFHFKEIPEKGYCVSEDDFDEDGYYEGFKFYLGLDQLEPGYQFNIDIGDIVELKNYPGKLFIVTELPVLDQRFLQKQMSLDIKFQNIAVAILMYGNIVRVVGLFGKRKVYQDYNWEGILKEEDGRITNVIKLDPNTITSEQLKQITKIKEAWDLP